MEPYDPQIDNPYPDVEWSEIFDFRYLTPLILRRESEAVRTRGNKNKDAHYIVGADYQVAYSLDGQERTIVVLRGMLTDLASVPRIAVLGGIGRVGPHLEASIVHDFLYIAWQYLNPPREAQPQDRRFADELFLVSHETGSRAVDKAGGYLPGSPVVWRLDVQER